MNRLAHWMMRLYPSRWRKRYGDELDALLSDTGADARVVTDLFRGGMRMQLKTWSFLKLALTLGIVGALLGAGLGLLLPSMYVSKATMQLTPAQISDDMVQQNISSQVNEAIQRLMVQVMSRTTLAHIINDPHLLLYKDELRTQPLEDVIEEMKSAIYVQFVALPGKLGKRASAFDIKFVYNDRYKAQQTVRALMNAFSDANLQAARASPNQSTSRVEVLDSASFPSSPAYPKWQTLLGWGLTACIMLAFAWLRAWKSGFMTWRFVLSTAGLAILGVLTFMTLLNRLDLLPNRQYRSVATVRLRGGNTDQVMSLTSDILRRTSLSGVINDPKLLLYSDQVKTTPLEDVIRTMTQHIGISVVGARNSPVFSISFEYPDRYKARATVSALIERLREADAQSFPNAAGQPATPAMVLDVLDTANLPMSPATPNRYMITFLGGLIGLAIASIVTFVRRRWRPEPTFPVDAIQD